MLLTTCSPSACVFPTTNRALVRAGYFSQFQRSGRGRRQLADGINPKDLKERLAKRIVAEMHGAEAGDQAFASWQAVHCQRLAPAEMAELQVAAATPVVDLMVAAELVPSRNQARQLIKGGGVRLDDVKVQDEKLVVTVAAGSSSVLQVGRRKFVRLVNPTTV
jgi:tyrosyl-tRNA synthetase